MRIDFKSKQYVEVITEGGNHELEFSIYLHCTCRGTPGVLSGPPEKCYPPESAEFELVTISLPVPKVNHHYSGAGKLLEYDPPLELDFNQFAALVGVVEAERLFDEACVEACQTGEFG